MDEPLTTTESVFAPHRGMDYLISSGIKRCHSDKFLAPRVLWSRCPPLFSPNPVPMPNLLKKTFSKSNPSESSSTADVPANDKGVPQKIAATSGGAVPAYSDSLKEAWAAAQQDLPKADKLLDRIGEWIVQ